MLSCPTSYLRRCVWPHSIAGRVLLHPLQATNIYRLRYDGNTLMIAENVSDSTGLGLGVHTTINPKDAESYAVSDGEPQKQGQGSERCCEP